MNKSLSNDDLLEYLSKQLNNNFPDNDNLNNLVFVVNEALSKLEYNFRHVALPYYLKDGKPFFNHLNSDHYTVFLYYCSNVAYKIDDISLASKFFYLNKIMNSFHCMYDTELPDIFIVCHGVGTVLGKAKYENFFVVTQGCTVGANARWDYPRLGKYLIMYPNSSILGGSIISNYVIASNNSMILNENIPDSCLVVGRYPNTLIKENNLSTYAQFFKSAELING